MSAPVTAARAAHQLSEEEITARYLKRVKPLIALHGPDSHIVTAVNERYGRMLDNRQATLAAETTDLTALADAVGALRVVADSHAAQEA